uniref:Intraflagellar transport protein 46 homolog n=1 Tax=Ascaris lumbricoides TaxID=6252 RepID=A0A0M3HSP8_ASCLU
MSEPEKQRDYSQYDEDSIPPNIAKSRSKNLTATMSEPEKQRDYSQYDEDSIPPNIAKPEIKHTHPGRPDLDYDDTPVGHHENNERQNVCPRRSTHSLSSPEAKLRSSFSISAEEDFDNYESFQS